MTEAGNAERCAIVAYLDRMKMEVSELGQTAAVFWIVTIRRDIERGAHLKEAQK